MDKEDVHIYNGILLGHKKEWSWGIYRDMNGPRDSQTVRQSEVSQKEENKYHILMHIYGI